MSSGLMEKVCGENATKFAAENIALALEKGCCTLSQSAMEITASSNGSASFSLPASAENITNCPDAFLSAYSFSPWPNPTDRYPSYHTMNSSTTSC